ncbi:hypothetical protein C4D60_Mb04t30970 [Musa balbisiana]|uniref:Uncharacterized protein n=1 Tax=Musa balbisiana TaxID=52838 RepID=A0A4S8KFW9_MUSBA|nr:hypothetical protein C4D60_Mb04t30970 [Musa balbisiana]
MSNQTAEISGAEEMFKYLSRQQNELLHGSPHRAKQYHENGGSSNAQESAFYSRMDVIPSMFKFRDNIEAAAEAPGCSSYHGVPGNIYWFDKGLARRPPCTRRSMTYDPISLDMGTIPNGTIEI